MYTEINEDEKDDICNKEPSKCRGWFWATIEECIKHKERLLYTLKNMLDEVPCLKYINYLKKMC